MVIMKYQKFYSFFSYAFFPTTCWELRVYSAFMEWCSLFGDSLYLLNCLPVNHNSVAKKLLSVLSWSACVCVCVTFEDNTVPYLPLTAHSTWPSYLETRVFYGSPWSTHFLSVTTRRGYSCSGPGSCPEPLCAGPLLSPILPSVYSSGKGADFQPCPPTSFCSVVSRQGKLGPH